MTKSISELLKFRIRAWDLITACGVVITVATLCAFGGSFWWFFDLFTHFRLQYFVGLVLVALILLIPRQYNKALCFAVIALINLGTMVPLYFGRALPPTTPSPSWRAMLINVNTQTGDPQRVMQAVQTFNPDILVLEEISESWLMQLQPLVRSFAHVKVEPRDDNFGIGFFSKLPVIQSEVRYFGGAEVPTVLAELETPNGRLTIIGTHPVPPSGAENSRLRNEQLERLAEFVKQVKSPVLLLGDLNATPWCPYFKRLLCQSGLNDSSQGRGILTTWPTFFLPLQIPIDHCLYSTGVKILNKARGFKVGSDHYPLMVDFTITTAVKSDVKSFDKALDR